MHSEKTSHISITHSSLVGQDLDAGGVPLERHVGIVRGLHQDTVTHLGVGTFDTAATEPGGYFTNVPRALQNNHGLSGDSGKRGPYKPCNHSLYTKCQKSQLWWEFLIETLNVCLKLCFGHTYKVSAWNSHKYLEVRYLQCTNFERISWRARETTPRHISMG